MQQFTNTNKHKSKTMTNSNISASASTVNNTQGNKMTNSVFNNNSASIFSHNGSIYGNFDVNAIELPLQGAAQRYCALVKEYGNIKAAYQAILNKGIKSFKVSFDFNNNTWVVTFPVEVFLAYGQFDVCGNADLNSSDDNVIQLAHTFLKVAAKGNVEDCVKLLRAQSVNTKISEFVVRCINNYEVQALRGAKGFYGKVVADWRIPQMISVGKGMLPVVYVSAKSPVWNNGAHSMTENEMVVLTRTPAPFSVVCVVKVAPFYLDDNVMAVNPLVMDVNHGDCDGDNVSIVAPRLSGGVMSVAEAMTFNSSKLSIGGYRQSLRDAGELSTTLEEMGKVAKMSDKTKTKMGKKYFHIHNTANISEWATTIDKVNWVYAKAVSKTYGIAFAALQEYVLRTEAGDETFTKEEMLEGVFSSFSVYEDKALCGFTKESYEFLNEYFAGNGVSNFVKEVQIGLHQAKCDLNDGEGLADTNGYAHQALIIRKAAKKVKSAGLNDFRSLLQAKA